MATFQATSLRVYCELTLIWQEVQHGLQQEGQVANRQARVAHATGGIHQFMEEAHLYSGPASVGTWQRGRESRELGDTDVRESKLQIERERERNLHYRADKAHCWHLMLHSCHIRLVQMHQHITEHHLCLMMLKSSYSIPFGLTRDC